MFTKGNNISNFPNKHGEFNRKIIHYSVPLTTHYSLLITLINSFIIHHSPFTISQSYKMITPTHINYYHLCHRKLWLFDKGIQMEHTSEQVYEGKLTGELSYQDRSQKYSELDLGNAKIDYYDAANRVVHEVKHSNKVENAHIAQVKYYLYLLVQHGIEGPKGILEYPRLRQRQEVQLTEDDVVEIEQWLKHADKILAEPTPPPVINKQICKKCSYFDFCYSE